MSTLSNYIAAGKVPAPKSVTSGGMTIHLWTEEEIEKVRKLLPKLKNGRKKPRRQQDQKPQARAPVPHKPHKSKR